MNINKADLQRVAELTTNLRNGITGQITLFADGSISYAEHVDSNSYTAYPHNDVAACFHTAKHMSAKAIERKFQELDALAAEVMQ